MDLAKVDREALKLAIKEVLKEDASLFKQALKEILIENQVIGENAKEERKQKLITMIEADFDQYDEVFKALA